MSEPKVVHEWEYPDQDEWRVLDDGTLQHRGHGVRYEPELAWSDVEDSSHVSEHFCEGAAGYGIARLAAEVEHWEALGRDRMTALEDMTKQRDALADQNKVLESEISDLCERVGTLKQEAQIHAQEARTHRATVRECYQAVTGGTGEPGQSQVCAFTKDSGLGKLFRRLLDEHEAFDYTDEEHADAHRAVEKAMEEM